MESIGVNNIRLFGDAFTSFPMESNRFRTVVGIFATPPNSFSAISDPIDLICSRGGDLSMLEVLTESEVSDEGRTRSIRRKSPCSIHCVLPRSYRLVLVPMDVEAGP